MPEPCSKWSPGDCGKAATKQLKGMLVNKTKRSKTPYDILELTVFILMKNNEYLGC